MLIVLPRTDTSMLQVMLLSKGASQRKQTIHCLSLLLVGHTLIHVHQQAGQMLQEEWPLLIIVPASLRLVWAEELEKWLPHLRPSSIHVIEGKSDRLQGSDLPAVCITSYEMMQRLTCDACKGIDGRPVVLTACAGSQVCFGALVTQSSTQETTACQIGVPAGSASVAL